MQYGTTIDALIAAGAVALYHDYRSGHGRDLSGNSNHGTFSAGCRQQGPAGPRVFPATTDEVTVADAASLRLTAGSIVAVSEHGFTSQIDKEYIVTHIPGATGFAFYLEPNRIRFWGDTVTPLITTNIIGKKSLAVSFSSGDIPIGYADGVSLGNFNVSATVTSVASDTTIGNRANVNGLKSPLSALLIANRILTPTEMASVHAELLALRWPSKQAGRGLKAGADDEVQFKTDWGYPISTANEGGTLHGQIGGLASPFRAGDTTGRWAVETDTVDGELAKVLTCKTAGVVYVPASSYYDATSTEAAYGTWDLWAAKSGGSNLRVQFVGDVIGNEGTTGQDGYTFFLNSEERIAVLESINGTPSNKLVTDVSQYTNDALNHYRITRSGTGETHVYMNGLIVGNLVNGTNPFTDNTTTTSSYMVFDLDAGDKISLGDITGNHSLYKQLGVVAP